MLKGDLVTLRPLEEADLPMLVCWRNEAFDSFFGPYYVTESGQGAWYRQYLGDPTDFMFIVEREIHRVGCIGLANIDLHHRRAELGRLVISQDYQMQGFGTDAARRLAQYAFDELGLHRLHLYVLADNAAAIKLHEAAGFRIEGTLAEHVWKHGAFQNVEFMARLAGQA